MGQSIGGGVSYPEVTAGFNTINIGLGHDLY